MSSTSSVPSKQSLSPARQRLVELMRRLHFGQVLDLHVRGGEPQFDPPPRVVRDLKLDSEPDSRPATGREDYLLKRPVVELLRFLDRLQDGVIDVVEVKHGLPFRLQYTEPPPE